MKQYPLDSTGLTDAILNPAWPENERPVDWITTLVVHHDAQVRPHDYDSLSRYRAEAQYQNSSSIPGSRGIQYHFHIDNTGVIFQLRPLTTLLWHCGDFPTNQHSLAVCLDGYFHPPENQQPTREQYEALSQLLDSLSTQHPEFPAVQSDVYPHRQFFATACCGDNLAPFVNEYRTSMGHPQIPAVPFDWPEYQPSALPTPVIAGPAPVTPPPPTPLPAETTTPSSAPSSATLAPAVPVEPAPLTDKSSPDTSSSKLTFLRRIWQFLKKVLGL